MMLPVAEGLRNGAVLVLITLVFFIRSSIGQHLCWRQVDALTIERTRDEEEVLMKPVVLHRGLKVNPKG